MGNLMPALKLLSVLALFLFTPLFLFANDESLSLLKQGGYTILFRVPDSIIGSDLVLFNSRDFKNCKEQRNLSLRGKFDSNIIKKAFVNQKIPVFNVTSSAYCRNLEASNISFPEKTIQIDRHLNSICRESSENMKNYSQILIDELSKPVSRGNRIIMGHQCNIQFILKQEIIDLGLGKIRLEAGEALIIKPQNKSYKVAGIVELASWYEWAKIPISSRIISPP